MRRLLCTLLLLGDMLLVALFMAGSAAYLVPPERLWALQLVALGVPYLELTMVGAIVATIVLNRWGLLACHVVVLVLATALPVWTTRGPGAPSVPTDMPPLRVATFNNPGGAKWAFKDLLANESPTIFAFQELPIKAEWLTGRTWRRSYVLSALFENGYQFSGPSSSNGSNTVTEHLFSRLESAGPSRVIAGYADEGLWKSGGIRRSLYRWQGRSIAVYSVHLRSFSSGRPWERNNGKRHLFSPSAWSRALHSYREDFKIRAQQARRLREELDAETVPFIVCGDLNSTPSNWVYSHLVRGLTDAFREAGAGWGGTYHARLPLFRIDYVLASDDWEVRQAQVSRVAASDHRPLVAELVLRNREGGVRLGY